MIVPNMSEAEIKKAVQADMPELLALAAAQNKKYRRVVIKTKTFPLYLPPIPKKTKAHNNWYLLIKANGKCDKDACKVTFVCIIGDDKGLWALIPSYGNFETQIVLHPPHFFRRFRERNNIPLSGIPLILRFTQINHEYIYEVSDRIHKDGKHSYVEVFGSCKEGIALGYYTQGWNILFKTFITDNMIKGQQIDQFTHISSFRKEIYGT